MRNDQEQRKAAILSNYGKEKRSLLEEKLICKELICFVLSELLNF
jgi:hypothetical protein